MVPFDFCHVQEYSKWGFCVNDKGYHLHFRASLTQNLHLSRDNQAKARVDLFHEPMDLLGDLLELIRSGIRILWRGIIKAHCNRTIYTEMQDAYPNNYFYFCIFTLQDSNYPFLCRTATYRSKSDFINSEMSSVPYVAFSAEN